MTALSSHTAHAPASDGGVDGDDAHEHPIRPITPSGQPQVGIIGAGGISRTHARGWLEQGAHLHVFSTQGAPEFASEFSEHPLSTAPVRVHGSVESLFAAVDVVDICTPTPSHADIVHKALNAGLHVLCEKPLTLDAGEAEELLQHAREARLLLYPAHVVRFFPQYEVLHRAVNAGHVGKLAVLRFSRAGSLPVQPWFSDDSQSGGLIMDQMIHDIDQALWLAGPASSVYARAQHGGSDHSLRAAHVVLEHVSGAISLCRGMWGAKGTAFTYNFDVAGQGGRLSYDSAAHTGITFDAISDHGSSEGFLPDITGIRDPYGAEIADFWRCVTGIHAEPRVNVGDAIRAITVAAAARESIRTGERITL